MIPNTTISNVIVGTLLSLSAFGQDLPSQLRIDHFIAGTGTVEIGFTLQHQQTVRLEFSDALPSTNWQTLTNITGPATNLPFTAQAPIDSSHRFYRLALADPREDMVFIPAGNFMLGSPATEVDRFGVEGPQVAVTISKGFWMGKTSVTQRDYQSVMGVNPSNHVGPDFPVERVNWFEATNYCAVLTVRERAAGRLAPTEEYRLPTEAEWEYACRAGTTTRFSYGDDPDYSQVRNYAWYQDNSDGMTHPVAQKLPNPWGLYDTYGNVLNWCSDWYGTYPGGVAIDPQGRASGTQRVIRGGAWLRIASHTRSAFRHSFDPVTKNILIGFRVILAPST